MAAIQAMPAPPSTSFHSPPLVRVLAGLGLAEVAPSQQSAAERWSPWLGWTDAILLSAALGATPSARADAAPPDLGALERALAEDCERVRSDLAQAIEADAALGGGPPSGTDSGTGGAPDAGSADFRHRYATHQRAMEAAIAPLRARARAALAAASADLGRLAELDAVLDGALAARARQLLSTVPAGLRRHFRRPNQARPHGDGPDDPAPTLQRALLAELELRMQPVEGLREALATEARRPAGGPP